MKKKILSLIISSFMVLGNSVSSFVHSIKDRLPINISDSSENEDNIASGDVDNASSDSQETNEESKEQTEVVESTTEDAAQDENISDDSSNISNSTSSENGQSSQNTSANTGEAIEKPSQSGSIQNGPENMKPNEENSASQGSTGSSINGLPSIPDKYSVEFLSAVENEILTLCNKERANAGLSPLVMDENMRSAARYKAEEMLQYGYFAHTSPYTGTPFDLLKKFGVSYNAAAENIQSGSGMNRASITAQYIVNNWMNSSGHKANILNGNFSRMGIGVVFTSSGNLAYESQLFAN